MHGLNTQLDAGASCSLMGKDSWSCEKRMESEREGGRGMSWGSGGQGEGGKKSTSHKLNGKFDFV